MAACCRVGGTGCGSAFMGAFEGDRHCLHYFHHSLVSGKRIGGPQSHLSTESHVDGHLIFTRSKGF